jgi:hypothetical protein
LTIAIALCGIYFVAEGIAAAVIARKGYHSAWTRRPHDLDLPGFMKEQKAWVTWGGVMRVVYVIFLIARLIGISMQSSN